MHGQCRKSVSLIQAAVVYTALFSLLLGRAVPANFPPQASLRASVRCSSPDHQRSCFEREGSRWAMLSSSFLPCALQSSSVKTSPSFDPLLPRSTKGFHYNRPPPLA